jgi:hypothetical protein
VTQNPKKPAKADPPTAPEDEEEEEVPSAKYEQAMILSGQDNDLAVMVTQIKPSHTNMWRDAIDGPCAQELKAGWRAVTQAGWGTQKNDPLSDFLFQIVFCLFFICGACRGDRTCVVKG